MCSCFNCVVFRAKVELLLFNSLLILLNLCVLVSIVYSEPILYGHDGVNYFAHPLDLFCVDQKHVGPCFLLK